MGGGASQVLFLQNGRGVGKRFSHAEGEGTTSFEVVLIQGTKGLDMLKGAEGAECFHPFKGGGGGGGTHHVLPCLKGGTKSFRQAIFPFHSPPPPPSL